MKKKKGISLIVLVIVIIVMLVLAAAVIITISNTGIIARGESSVDSTNIANIQESAQIIKAQSIMTNTRLTQAELIAELKGKFEGSTVNENVITTKDGKYDIVVDENLKITVTWHTETVNVWKVYEIYDAVANVSEAALVNLGLNKNSYSQTFIKIESIYKQRTLQEHKEQYILRELFGTEVPDLTADDLALLVTNASSMEELITYYSSQLGYSVTRDDIVYTLLLETTDEDSMLKQLGYDDAAIKAIEDEYSALEQPQIPSEYTNKTFAVKFENQETEIVLGSTLGTYVDRYVVTINGEYELTVSDESKNESENFVIDVLNIPYEDDYYVYSYIEGGYSAKVKDRSLSSYGPMLESIGGIPVISAEMAYEGCENLVVSPKLPDTIKNMVETFYMCTSLTTITNIPTSIENMAGAFYGCTSLTTVPVLPNSIKDMSSTFYMCTNLTTITNIPTSVEVMSGTFWMCTNLTTVPDITSSDLVDLSYTFYCCNNLAGTIVISSKLITNCDNAIDYAGTLVDGLTIVVPDDNVRQLLIDNSNYNSLKVAIVKSL